MYTLIEKKKWSNITFPLCSLLFLRTSRITTHKMMAVSETLMASAILAGQITPYVIMFPEFG